MSDEDASVGEPGVTPVIVSGPSIATSLGESSVVLGTGGVSMGPVVCTNSS